MDDYYDNLQRVNPGFGKPRFSKKELKDILISVLVLSVAFTILYRDSQFIDYFAYSLGSTTMGYVAMFGMSIVLVVLSFLFHEFGHKFVAQRYGMWSEFRMWTGGLVLTLITSILGFLFAAPGAVCIAGNVNKEANGKISIAGPAVNIVIGIIALALCFACNHSVWIIPFYLLANLNAFLAVFNLLPVPPLDGSKIIKWNVVAWVVAIAIGAALLYVMWTTTWYMG